ncbi:Pentatricopeptide repeat-containing protein [Apostasia shenzhenica]|uniref:Pentatricopeptide repeat-containing protein n=1 Tax=Apostasia shenzhenica TaxID=1088818 RepID=A0A2H9ZYH6_9ASPA|nr:Pentatricopeptide repeat-containing protein [Apostasia shenzhenica]
MVIRWQTRRHLQHSVFRSSSSSSAAPTNITGDPPFVSAAVAILREQRSRSRWNYLRSMVPDAGISPAEASAIIIRLKNNPRLAHRFFLWSRDLKLCSHDLSSFSAIVHILARSRLRPAALSLLRAALRAFPDSAPSAILQTLTLTYSPCDSAPFVFDLLIQAYLHSHRLDLSLIVARALRSRGIRPIVSTSNSLLRATGKLRGSVAAVDLYEELFHGEAIRPNLQTFNDLLLALYRDGRSEAVGSVISEMERFGCEPSAFTYSILMAGFCDEGNTGDARRLWEEMQRKGIQPDATAYNTLIGGYCEAGEVGTAEELFREMEVGGIEPTSTTFELLITGHCRAAGDVEAAVLLYRDMKRRGFRPEVEVVNEVLDEMRKRKMVDEGLRMLREEMMMVGFSPSRRSYVLLIRGFCDAGRMEEAAMLQAEMAGRGLEADAEVYEAFIGGYERAGDWEKAVKLKEEMIKD